MGKCNLCGAKKKYLRQITPASEVNDLRQINMFIQIRFNMEWVLRYLTRWLMILLITAKYFDINTNEEKKMVEK